MDRIVYKITIGNFVVPIPISFHSSINAATQPLLYSVEITYSTPANGVSGIYLVFYWGWIHCS